MPDGIDTLVNPVKPPCSTRRRITAVRRMPSAASWRRDTSAMLPRRHPRQPRIGVCARIVAPMRF